ncbi:MAG: hypothetical protein WBG11_04270 [Methylocella sp.]
MTATATAKTDKKTKQETSRKDRQKQLDHELADSFPARRMAPLDTSITLIVLLSVAT